MSIWCPVGVGFGQKSANSGKVGGAYDKDLKVWFRVSGHLMGDIVKTDGSTATVSAVITINDGDEPEADYLVELLYGSIGGSEPVKTAANKSLIGNGTVKFENIKYDGKQEYYLARITQKMKKKPKDMAWTAPVWMEK